MGELEFPRRILHGVCDFAGQRVNTYQKMAIIQTIKSALEESELKTLADTQFGKLLEIPSKPAWSGTFALFLVVRQLDVTKEYEIWVVFGGTPIRFSLREFKLVTGLKCGKLPTVGKKRRKVNASNEEPYSKTLFEVDGDVTVERAINMLRKKTVKDPDDRLRYACLALVDGILLPTMHYPRVKLNPEHVEMSRNLDEFLAYPWGRKSYEMIMSSLKGRDIAQLATPNVVVQGFVYALQMVILEAVPAIQETLTPKFLEPTDPEDDFVPSPPQRVTLKLNPIRDMDKECEVEVVPIILPDEYIALEDEDLSWSDEEEDPRVDMMVNLAEEGFDFDDSMFVGGDDPPHFVVQDRPVKVGNRVNRRRKKGKAILRPKGGTTSSSHSVATDTVSNHDVIKAVKSMLAQWRLETHGQIAQLVKEELVQNNPTIINGVLDVVKGMTVLEKGCIPQQTDLYGGTANRGGVEQTFMPRSPAGQSINEALGRIPANDDDGVSAIFKYYKDLSSPERRPTMVEDSSILHGENGPTSASQETTGPVELPLLEVNNENGPIEDNGIPLDTQSEEIDVDLQVHTFFEVEKGPSTDMASVEPTEGQGMNVGDKLADSDVVDKEPSPQNTSTVPPVGEDINQGDNIETSIVLEKVPSTDNASIPANVAQVTDTDVWVCVSSLANKEGTDNTSDGHLQREEESTLAVDSKVVEFQGRKSKRSRTLSSKLDDRFVCDKKIKTIIGHSTPPQVDEQRMLEIRFDKLLCSMKSNINIGDSSSISAKDVLDLIGREKNTPAKVMDGLWKVARNILRVDLTMKQRPRIDILDTKFVSSLTRLFSKFNKSKNRHEFTFSKGVIEGFNGSGDEDRPHSYPDADWLYMPFNFDKNHWVSLAVDVKSKKIFVLDPNHAIRNESTLKREIHPIAAMMPYLFNRVRGEVAEETQEELPEMEINRVAGIPQVTRMGDAGVMSTLLIMAHATGGEAECHLLGSRPLDFEIKKLVIALLE